MSEDGGSDNNNDPIALPLDPVVLVLLGWTTTVRVLWDYIQRPTTLIAWFILCIAPRWKRTFTIVTLIPPVVHLIIYASVLLLPSTLLPKPSAPTVVDIYNMDSIQALLATPTISYCGSIHHLPFVAFDMLIARWIALDAVETCRVSYIKYYILVVPCLFAAYCDGRVGFLCYVLLRLTQILAPPLPATDTNDHKKRWEERNRNSAVIDDGDRPIRNLGDDEDNYFETDDYVCHNGGNVNAEEGDDVVSNDTHHETPASYNDSDNDCDAPIGNNRSDRDDTEVPHPAPPKDDRNYRDRDKQENGKNEKEKVDNEKSKEENHQNAAMLEEEERFLQALYDPIIQDVDTDNILFPLPNCRLSSMSSSTPTKRPDTSHGIPNFLKQCDDFRGSVDDFQDDFLRTLKTATDRAIADVAHVPTLPKISDGGHRQGQPRKGKLRGIDTSASVRAMHGRRKPRSSLNEEIESPVDVVLHRQGKSPCNHRSSSRREVPSSRKEVYQRTNFDRFRQPGEIGHEQQGTEAVNQTKTKKHSQNKNKRKSTGSSQNSDRQGNKRVYTLSQHCGTTNHGLVNANSFEDRAISRGTRTFPSSSVADGDDVAKVHNQRNCGDGQSTVASMKSSKLQCKPRTPSNQSTKSYDHICKSPSDTTDLHEEKPKRDDVWNVVKAIEANSEIAYHPRLQRHESYDRDELTPNIRSTSRIELAIHTSPGRHQLKQRLVPQKVIDGHDEKSSPQLAYHGLPTDLRPSSKIKSGIVGKGENSTACSGTLVDTIGDYEPPDKVDRSGSTANRKTHSSIRNEVVDPVTDIMHSSGVHTPIIASTSRLELAKHTSPGRHQRTGRFVPQKVIDGHDQKSSPQLAYHGLPTDLRPSSKIKSGIVGKRENSTVCSGPLVDTISDYKPPDKVDRSGSTAKRKTCSSIRNKVVGPVSDNESPKKKPFSIGRTSAFASVKRIAIGKTVYDQGCSVRYDLFDNTLTIKCLQMKNCCNRKSSGLRGSGTFTIHLSDELEELRFCVPAVEGEIADNGTWCDDLDGVYFIALRVKKTDTNGLGERPKTYQPDSDDKKRKYIVIEYRSENEFEEMRQIMSQDDVFRAYFAEELRLPVPEAKGYCTSILEAIKLEKQRRSSVSSPSKPRTRDFGC